LEAAGAAAEAAGAAAEALGAAEAAGAEAAGAAVDALGAAAGVAVAAGLFSQPANRKIATSEEMTISKLMAFFMWLVPFQNSIYTL
jgi:hypothetical protein